MTDGGTLSMEDNDQENSDETNEQNDHSAHEEDSFRSNDKNKGPIRFGSGEDPTKITIEKNPGEIIQGTWGFLRSILSLRKDNYDVPSVVKEIQGGIEFKGYNVWILVCSILVASVGLNMNSTAVIVGAMLISPLMGPIRGIGFGVAMNDFRMLVESVKNFGVTVAISLVVATIYFWASPINTLTHELADRTSPTFMDVVIAFFGGLAGVIAAAKGKIDTVIPGVAIATALMPPLCTVGFGIAHGQWTNALGASYLFLLNSLLIGLSTVIFIRYLKFPKKEYLTPKIERKVRNYIIIFMIVIISPSGYLFYKMAKRSIFEANAELFVKEVIQKTDPNMSIEPTYEFDWKNSHIHLEISNFHADSGQITIWDRSLENYDLGYAEIKIKQDKDLQSIIDDSFKDFDVRNQGVNTLAEALAVKDQQLYKLFEEIDALKARYGGTNNLEMDHIIKGFHLEYPEISRMSIDQRYKYTAAGIMDTSYVLNIGFDPSVGKSEKKDIKDRVGRRLLHEIKEKTNSKQDSLIINMIK